MNRTLEPEAFIRIANDPSVRPAIGGEGDMAPLITALVSNPENFAFLTDCRQGGYLYVKLGLGLYEVHTLALPSARGRPMLRAMWQGLAAMFLQTDAVEIVTTVADGNRGADAYAKHAGFREMFRRGPLSFRSLGYADWVLKDPDNADFGRAFHEEIHRYTPDDHGDDAVHDQWVGAALRGVRGGNAAKWTLAYNRWAAHAMYGSVSLVSLHPPTLDIGTAVVQITPSGLEVIKVRTARSAPSQNEVEGITECLSAPP